MAEPLKVYAEIPEDDTRPGSVRRGDASGAGRRQVIMTDGQIINGVPAGVTDEQVRAEYDKQMTDIAAEKHGYPAEAARQLGFPEKKIGEYVREHPRYDVEQATKKEMGGMPWWQRELEGVKAGAAETWTGIKQIVPEALRNMGLEPRLPGQQTPTERLRAEAEAQQARGRAIRETGGALGYTAEKIAEVLTPAVVARLGGLTTLQRLLGSSATSPVERYGSAATQGAAYGEMQPVTGEEEKLDKVLQGVAVTIGGQGLADAVRGLPFALKQRALSGLNSLLPNAPKLGQPEERQLLLDLSRKRGYELTAAQQTGSKALEGIQAGFEALPLGGVNVTRMAAKNRVIDAQTQLASIGRGGREVNARILDDAGTDIGRELDAIKGKKIKIDLADFRSDLDKALQEHEELMHPDARTISMLNDWRNIDTRLPGAKPGYKGTQLVNVTADGGILQKNRSALIRDIRAAAKSDNPNWQEVQAKSAIVEAIDDAVEKSLPKADAAAYRDARTKYRNLVALEIAKAQSPLPDYINPVALDNALKVQRGRRAVATTPTGQDDLIDLTRIHNEFKLRTPDSGTAGRVRKSEAAMDVARLVTPGAAGGLTSAAMFGTSAAAPGAIAAYPAVSALGAGLTSSTLGKYLTQPMTEQGARDLSMLIRAHILGLQNRSPLGQPALQ